MTPQNNTVGVSEYRISTLIRHRKLTARNSNTTNVSNLIKILTTPLVSSGKNLTIVSLICRSVKNKAVSLCDFILSNQMDLFAITETWLEDELDKYVLSELAPNGYDVQHVPRYKRKGGGVAIVHSNAIKLKPIDKFSANINC